MAKERIETMSSTDVRPVAWPGLTVATKSAAGARLAEPFSSRYSRFKLFPVWFKAVIRAYQSTRFMRPSCCRFYPSCSDYCLQAIDTHGLIAGVVLTVKRLLKCHPWHPGGVDLVSNDGGVS